MLSFKEFNEGLLDDLIGDFGNVDIKQKSPIITKKVKPQKKYKPRIYDGVKPTNFIEYIRSKPELKKLLDGKISLNGIINLFAKENKALTDNVIVDINTSEINNIREYDRKIIDGWTGKSTTTEISELESDIKKNGIKNYSVVTIKRLHNGNVSVILGEGNHRLMLAKKLKIKKIPIMFYFSK